MDIKIKWNEDKNELLKRTRNVSFEMVQIEIDEGRYTEPEINKIHPHQYITIVIINDYPHVVPFVKEEDNTWFLKTIYPSRKYKGKI